MLVVLRVACDKWTLKKKPVKVIFEAHEKEKYVSKHDTEEESTVI